MRHHNKNRKFGRTRGQRAALLRSLARSLALEGKIKTTEARAKEIKPMVEKMVTRGKTPSLANRRVLLSRLQDERAVNALITKAEGYQARQGGYLRITKIGARRGDAAAMAVIEFV